MSSPIKPPKPPVRHEHSVRLRLKTVSRHAIKPLAQRTNITPLNWVLTFMTPTGALVLIARMGNVRK